MVKIEIDTNGLKSAIEKAAIKAASEHVKKAVGTLRCSEHDKSPTVKIKGSLTLPDNLVHFKVQS